MHIAFYSDTFPPQVNGVAGVVNNLADEFSAQGHIVTVCAPAEPGQSIIRPRRLPRQFGKYELIRYTSAQLPSYKEQRITVPSVLGSLWWIRKSRPDIIHVHTPFGMGWEAAAVSKMLGIPMIGTLHTFYMEYLKHVHLGGKIFKPLTSRFEPTFFNRCLLITSPSQSLADELKSRGVYRPTRRVINPVAIEQFKVTEAQRKQAKKELAPDGLSLVYIGRVSYEKNLEELVDIVVPLLREDPKLLFYIVGEGPSLSKLKQKVKQIGLADQIIIAGLQRGEALKKYLAAGDIFVTASLSENQPLSIIEAMAAGLPVVAYAAKGIPEVVENNRTGRLIGEGRPTEFRAAIRELLSGQSLRQTLSEQARKKADQYSRRAVAQELMGLYQNLISDQYS